MSARHCPTPTASWTNVIFPFGLATMSPIQFADSDPRATRSVMVATFSFFGAGSGFSEFMKLTNQYDRQSARSDGMSLAQTDCGKPRRSAHICSFCPGSLESSRNFRAPLRRIENHTRSSLRVCGNPPRRLAPIGPVFPIAENLSLMEKRDV